MTSLSQPTDPGAAREPGLLHRLRLSIRWPTVPAAREVGILLLASAFLLLFGLVPVFGGDQLGLVGADEPRYAQIAREMLQAHTDVCRQAGSNVFPHSLHLRDLRASYRCLSGGTITPILYGSPWLEKPALYYWRAMGFFREFGVSDWSARLPSSSGAFALIVLIFLHMRRFRPGGQLYAALITLSCVGVVGFARGASTDMQLAAPFSIAMLGWYAWYETGKKFWLFDLYFFGAAATLAKGPVAPLLALAIIVLFAGLRREWSLLRRTVWIPGILLYLVMVLPWYLAVQRSNPTFYRQFFLEHNLERYATNRYQHHQPFWYYLAVLLIALMPWTAIAGRALVDAVGESIAEWKARRKPQRYLGHSRTGDAFPEFLVLWAVFPIVFFSFSGSKLPGYILPSLPPITILTGDYLQRIHREGLSTRILLAHAAVVAILVFVLVLAPQHMKYETLVPSTAWLVSAAVAALLAAGLVAFTVRRKGLGQAVNITLLPVLAMLIFLLGFHGKDLDINYSARPLARQMHQLAPELHLLATEGVKRDMVYGLAFYRDEPLIRYDKDGVPAAEHLLVLRGSDTESLQRWLQGRVYHPLLLFDAQGLAVYRVAAATR